MAYNWGGHYMVGSNECRGMVACTPEGQAWHDHYMGLVMHTWKLLTMVMVTVKALKALSLSARPLRATGLAGGSGAGR